jgi:hypothetical protein
MPAAVFEPDETAPDEPGQACQRTCPPSVTRSQIGRNLAFCVALLSTALAAPVGSPAPAKPPPEFAPRKAYREYLNRNFTLRLIRERNVASPDTIADEALFDCRTEERALAAFSEALMPVVEDRMRASLVSSGHVPENLWWP